MLLRALRGHLRRLDLSGLAIREAYLQGVEMQDASLMEAIPSRLAHYRGLSMLFGR